MSKTAITFGTIWICVALAGIFFLVKGISKKQTIFGEDKIMEQIEKFDEENNALVKITAQNNEFNSQRLNKIEVTSNSASLILNKSTDDKIHVNIIGRWAERELPYVACENGKLIVRTKNHPFIFFHFVFFDKKQIEIFVPSECISESTEITTECASGSTNITDYDVGTIVIQNASGSIKLNSCTAKKARISSASGSIKAENCEFDSIKTEAASGSATLNGKFKQFTVECASGSIKIEDHIPFTDDCSIETASGSITLRIPENCDYKGKYESFSGSIKDELCGISGSRECSATKGNGNVTLKASTASGSIRIFKL